MNRQLENRLRTKVRRILERRLKEESGPWDKGGDNRKMQEKFAQMETGDVVPIINAHTDWDYNKIAELVAELLTDANFHDESGKVYDFMMSLE